MTIIVALAFWLFGAVAGAAAMRAYMAGQEAKRNERLRVALAEYADPHNWQGYERFPTDGNGWDTAARALEGDPQ